MLKVNDNKSLTDAKIFNQPTSMHLCLTDKIRVPISTNGNDLFEKT